MEQNKTQVLFTMRSAAYWIALIANTSICFFAIADAFRYQFVPVLAAYILYILVIVMSIFYVKVENKWIR